MHFKSITSNQNFWKALLHKLFNHITGIHGWCREALYRNIKRQACVLAGSIFNSISNIDYIFLKRLTKQILKETIPAFYRASKAQDHINTEDWDWRYFMAGSLLLAPTFISARNAGNESSSSGGDSSSSSCGSGCSSGGDTCGSSCSSCGGCGEIKCSEYFLEFL